MHRRIAGGTLAVLALTALACTANSPQASPPAATETPAMTTPQGTGWRPLFDGSSTAAWRGFRSESLPAGWQAVDGTLARVGGGGDIITREQFANFELELDWRVQAGGNSGVMFRVTEAAEATYETGPEMQVLDDARHADGQSPLTSAGAAYGLYPAPRGIVKPAGEWNSARLVVDGAHVEHWLNGTKLLEYELWSPEWKAKVAASKFAEWPGYGMARRGHIALQDHGDPVAYRNIRIRTRP